MSRHLAAALCATVSLLTATAAAAPAFADQFASEAAPVRTISVPKDKALSFRLDEPATKIVVSQPDIAEVVATTDRSFYVRGLDVGVDQPAGLRTRRPAAADDRRARRL